MTRIDSGLAERGEDSPTAAPLTTETPSALACANCGAQSATNFCGECGAPRLEARPLTVRRFASDLWNEATNVDSVTIRTLTTLFRRPGELTREYVAGRTRWFLPPIRVFLLMFAVMIFARTASRADVRIEREMRARIAAAQSSSADLATIRERRARSGRQAPEFTEPLTRAMRVALSNQWLHLLDPLTVGLVLALLHRARRCNYAQHVVFALHLLAFNWALTVVSTALHARFSATMSAVDAVSLMHWAAFGVYAFLALRRVHQESPLRTGVKAVALSVGSQAAMAVVPVITATTVTVWAILVLR